MLSTTIRRNSHVQSICIEAEEKINKILLTCGDRIGGDFTSARVNGGGFMPQDETNTVHKYTFYLIKRKAV